MNENMKDLIQFQKHTYNNIIIRKSKKDTYFSRFFNDIFGCFILITKRMSSYNDRLFPTRNDFWYGSTNYWFSKYSSTEYISDGTIRTGPHFFQIEFCENQTILMLINKKYVKSAFFGKGK